MTKSRTLRKAGAVVLSLAMAFSVAGVAPSADAAAKKPALSAKKGTITVGKTKAVKIQNTTKKKVKKLVVSSSNKKVATVTKKNKVKFIVTGKKAGTAKITAKVTLKKAVAKKKKYTLKYTATVKAAATPAPLNITGVSLDNTTPKISETITATLEPEGATNIKSYQWYRTSGTEELLIKGETASTYTVGVGDVGCSLYVVVTNTAGEKFYSKETSRIQRAEVTGLAVTGMSGKIKDTDKSASIPVSGDTLSAAVTPANAASLVTYQWYRGTSAITGATGANYTVTDEDQGNKLTVKITAVDTQATTIAAGKDSAATALEACRKIENITTSLNKTTNIQSNDTITATVKDGTKDLTLPTQFTIQWYTDEAKAGNEAKGAGATTKSYTVAAGDNGKKLIAKVTGVYTGFYYGSVELATGAAQNEITQPTISSDSKTGNLLNLGVGNSLIAKIGKDETATFQWYRDGVEISGATKDTYTLTADDKDSHRYKVVATGTGSFTGTKQAETGAITIAAGTTIEKFIIKNSAGNIIDDANVHIGETLSASVVPSAATSSILFTWAYVNDKGDVEKTTGASFTVPANIAISANDTKSSINVSALYVGDTSDVFTPGADAVYSDAGTKTAMTYALNNPTNDTLEPALAATITAEATTVELKDRYYYLPEITDATNETVANGTDEDSNSYAFDAYRKLDSVTVTYDNSESGNKLASGYKAFEKPEVGIYAHAAVSPSVDGITYQWYRNDASKVANRIPGATEKDYLIKKDDIGAKLICKAIASTTATDKYCDAVLDSAASVEVAASSRTIASILITNAAIADATAYKAASTVSKLVAGTTYRIYALDSTGALITEGVDYIWDGADSASYIAETAAWKAVTGKGIITVTVKPDGKNYTGDPVTYTFATEVGAGEAEVVSTTSTVSMVGGTAIPAEGTTLKTVSTEKDIKVSPKGFDSVASVRWYEADGANAAGVAIAVSGGDESAATVQLAASKITAGKVYYAVMKDPDGNTYTSEKVVAAAPVLTKIAALADVELTTGTAGDALNTTDQFGNEYAKATNGSVTAATGNAGGSITLALDTNKKLTVDVASADLVKNNSFTVKLGNVTIYAKVKTAGGTGVATVVVDITDMPADLT